MAVGMVQATWREPSSRRGGRATGARIGNVTDELPDNLRGER
jgi:hypothetical protein